MSFTGTDGFAKETFEEGRQTVHNIPGLNEAKHSRDSVYYGLIPGRSAELILIRKRATELHLIEGDLNDIYVCGNGADTFPEMMNELNTLKQKTAHTCLWGIGQTLFRRSGYMPSIEAPFAA